MLLTKIPPAITKEEISEHIVNDVGNRRYVVEDAATHQILASDLTRRQTMEFTWLHDGRGYEIKPRMGVLHDDLGVATEIKHQLSEAFGMEWDVYFKDGPDQPWRRSRITAYGPNERDALLDLIDQAFARRAWSDAFFVRQVGITDPRSLCAHFPPATIQHMAVGG